MTEELLEPDDLGKLQELVKYKGADRVVHFTDFLLDKANSKSNKRFVSGFSSLENKIQGIEAGEVVVITGHTKAGKTLFAESWIHGMTKRDPEARAVIFSFEVQTEKLLIKYQKSGLDLPIYVPLRLETMSFDWLYSRCLEAKLKFNCRIILIDHLHFLVDMNTKQNMSLNIGAFMRRLKKDIALDLDLAVILIAHQGQPKDKQEASLANMRDSSFIGQESDSTIVVTRRKNMDNIEIQDYSINYPDVNELLLFPPAGSSDDDQYSANLAIVKVEVHRRTGVYDWKKLFKKSGDFMEEI